jgi:membrane protein required for colicin V production
MTVDLTGLDVVLLIIILFLTIRGIFRGFVREFMAMASVILGITGGMLFSGTVAVMVEPWFGSGVWGQVISFLGIFLVVYLLVRIFENALNRLMERINLESLDRAMGFFLGLGEGVLVSFVLVFLLRLQPFFDTRELLQSSVVAQVLAPLFPYAERLFTRQG